MGKGIGLGRRRPDGAKIAALRRQKELKQTDLAGKAGMGVRTLRNVELSNDPLPATTITAIAAALKVNQVDITLSTPDGSPTKAGSSLLKLRAVRSATELSALAAGADTYEWLLKIDPVSATAADMQAVLAIVRHLVPGTRLIVGDEFDKEPFGEIPRLARLQDLLNRLRTKGVNVIAGTYTHSWLSLKEDKDWFAFDEICVRIPGKKTKQFFRTKLILSIRFVPCDVEEEVLPINTGPSLEDFELVDEISFLR